MNKKSSSKKKVLNSKNQGSSAKQKVLIIEDEKILAEMYYDAFVSSGFKVFSVNKSGEGLVVARKEKPDLIILDILLPKEDGISFLKELKEEPDISSIPVVVFTNYDGADIKKKAEKLGVSDYLIKANFTPQEFVARIKSYLK